MSDEQVVTLRRFSGVITYDRPRLWQDDVERYARTRRVEDMITLLAHLGVTQSFVVGLSDGGHRQALDLRSASGDRRSAGGSSPAASAATAAPTQGELHLFKTYRAFDARRRTDRVSALASGVIARSSRSAAASVREHMPCDDERDRAPITMSF